MATLTNVNAAEISNRINIGAEIHRAWHANIPANLNAETTKIRMPDPPTRHEAVLGFYHEWIRMAGKYTMGKVLDGSLKFCLGEFGSMWFDVPMSEEDRRELPCTEALRVGLSGVMDSHQNIVGYHIFFDQTWDETTQRTLDEYCTEPEHPAI